MGTARSAEEHLSPTLRERLSQIRACEKSGESLKAYAERHAMSVGSLYQAKKLARQQGALPPHRTGTRGRARDQHAADGAIDKPPRCANKASQ